MFGLGIWELLIIMVIVLVLFSRRLPEIGRGLGSGIKNFRKSIHEKDEIDVTPSDEKKDQQTKDQESAKAENSQAKP